VRIVPYDEVRDGLGFTRVMHSSFWWAALPERIAELRRLDPRYRETYGYALVRDGRVLGFAGVMDIPVRTLDRGVEKAGGIFAVGTLPDMARRGIATRLLERCHQHFRGKGYRFSFLFTSHTLVARSLYVRLGYSDLPRDGEYVGKAVKLLQKSKAKKPKGPRPKPDYGRMERLFAEVLGGRDGFTPREPGWVRAVVRAHHLNPSEFIVERDGYALLEPERDCLYVAELVARNSAAAGRILRRAMARGKRLVVAMYLSEPWQRALFRRNGFNFQRRNYGCLMVKPLGATPFRRAFSPRFYYSLADQF
jgi:GNAT superfamily N-acetyltransferase